MATTWRWWQRSATLTALAALAVVGVVAALVAGDCAFVTARTHSRLRRATAFLFPSSRMRLELSGTRRLASMQDRSANKSQDKSRLSCVGLRNVERVCSLDGCTVLADRMRGRSCADFCGTSGLACVGAWDEVNEDCRARSTMSCDSRTWWTSDLICRCEPASPQLIGSTVSLSTFFWNVHWECSMAARGASANCKQLIGKRFAELAHDVGADVVSSVMLADAVSTPAHLPAFGLANWWQVDGSCAHASGLGDTVALAFSPGWVVRRASGGCLRNDIDTRAFAVALATPPPRLRVRECPDLCIVALHAPHQSITRGSQTVAQICGDAVRGCALAMGDWNVPADEVAKLWGDVIGGSPPSRAAPDQRTCCFPETQHYGYFDHVAFNIAGALHENHTVHDYQHVEENPVKQHKAVSARLLLPSAA